MVLVTGATGNIGQRVVAGLLQAGERVRAMTRDPARAGAPLAGAEVVRADFEDRRSLQGALRGVERVLLLSAASPALPRHDLALIEAAQAGGVQHVVKLSAFGTERHPQLALGAWHRAGELALEQSDLSWTLLRPTGFASNALGWLSALRERAPVTIASSPGRQAVIDPRDVAEVAVACLLEPRHQRRAYTLTGPELLGERDQLAILAQRLGVAPQIEEISPETLQQRLVSMGLPPEVAGAFFEGVTLLRDGGAELLTEDVHEVLGRKARSFTAWVHDHVLP